MDAEQLDRLTEDIRSRMERLQPLGGTVLLDLGEGEGIYIDSREGGHQVRRSQSDIDSDCRVRIQPALLTSILGKQSSGFAAFMSGKIAVRGDMSVAVKLRGLLS